MKARKEGWWAISGDALLSMLRRASAGEDPDLIYIEEWANSDHNEVPRAAEDDFYEGDSE